MSLGMRNGSIDVAVVSGARLMEFPTRGVRVLSQWCADAGLSVGWYGGGDLKPIGVLPSAGSGGVLIIEDSQRRIHRIKARSIVRVGQRQDFPDPFQGWFSPGLLPEATARKLVEDASVFWGPLVVILGTGNRALRLGSQLLKSGTAPRVICLQIVEGRPLVEGWEVERLRFERYGGRISRGTPLELALESQSRVLWSLKIRDDSGTRILSCSRVIACGPFEEDVGFQEYPAGSLLVDWKNTEVTDLTDDVETSLLDQARATVLAHRIIRTLTSGISVAVKAALDRAVWKSKQALKELEELELRKLTFEFKGKWLKPEHQALVDEFPGYPKVTLEKVLPAIDCLEPIACRVCEKQCPVQAIDIDRSLTTPKFLIEESCTGCGICVTACPSEAITMIDNQLPKAVFLIFPWYLRRTPEPGVRVHLLNRKGDILGQARIADIFLDGEPPLIRVEVPEHLMLDAKGVRLVTAGDPTKETADALYQEAGLRVEITIQDQERRVRDGQLLSLAMIEIGHGRPNDILVCEDGSCGLCTVDVDGQKKFACQTKVRQGMNVHFIREDAQGSSLCPCEGISVEDFDQSIAIHGGHGTDAALQFTAAMKGRCHGALCASACLRRVKMHEEDQRYADWSFPSFDWQVKPR
jgi:ferredoxin